jgi:hypothetical protein
MGLETCCIPGASAHLMHLLQQNDLLPLVHTFGSGHHTGSTGTDDHHITGFLDGFVGFRLGFGLLRICNTAIVTYLHTLAAGNALLRVDPVLGVSKGNGMDGTFHPALMAAGAILLVNDIGHDRFLLSFNLNLLYQTLNIWESINIRNGPINSEKTGPLAEIPRPALTKGFTFSLGRRCPKGG